MSDKLHSADAVTGLDVGPVTGLGVDAATGAVTGTVTGAGVGAGVAADAGAGAEAVSDFWLKHYLDSYITPGGSKIKFLTGDDSRSRARCLELFISGAEQRGFAPVSLTAKITWMHDFKEIYTAVLRNVDFTGALQKCAELVVRQMGYDPLDIPAGTRFADYLAQKDEFDPITRRELRNQIVKLFARNPRMDKNFAVCSALLMGGVLGYPAPEPAAEALLHDWLGGAGRLRATALRKLGMSGVKITKQNARHMLRSLVEVLKTAGYKGLVVCVDNLEILATVGRTADQALGQTASEVIRYTKMRREDAYESIRELIDDIDSLTHTMFVFAFDRGLLDDEASGFKSYQALWMRIQNEVEGGRLNRFADIIDL